MLYLILTLYCIYLKFMAIIFMNALVKNPLHTQKYYFYYILSRPSSYNSKINVSYITNLISSITYDFIIKEASDA